MLKLILLLIVLHLTEGYNFIIPLKHNTLIKTNVHTSIPIKFISKSYNNRLSFKLNSFISADDRWTLWAIASSAASIGLQLEKYTKFGKSLSGPVCAMLVTAILTNIGILPSSGSIHLVSLQSNVVKIATPLLLLGANLNVIINSTGNLLKAFLLGTFGTILGSIIGYGFLSSFLPLIGTPNDSWKICAAISAKNIGGGLNFMSVVDTFAPISPNVIGLALAVDNFLGLLYFPLISWLGRNHENIDTMKEIKATTITNNNNNNNNNISHDKEIEDFLSALSISLLIAASGEYLSKSKILGNISPIPISTFITLFLASTLIPNINNNATIITAGEKLGKLLLLLFFGAIGNSSGTIISTITSKGSFSLLLYGIILYGIHLITILTLGKLQKIDLPDILIASNANIGNAATASALASSKGWNNKILPAILVGTLGNSIGTFIGIILGTFIFKPFSNVKLMNF